MVKAKSQRNSLLKGTFSEKDMKGEREVRPGWADRDLGLLACLVYGKFIPFPVSEGARD